MDPTARIARKMAELADMGFQRVESPATAVEVTPVGGGRSKVTCAEASMGTLVSITSLDASADRVQEAAALAFREMTRVVDLLNRYDSRSALSYLNMEGYVKRPPPELAEVMSQAWYFHKITAGSFDHTVQPLVDLLRLGRFRPGSASGPPSIGPREADIRDALALVDGRRVELKPDEIRLTKPGMGVTLDGIAKGYVVDCMVALLREQGLSDFLVDAGGDIRAVGVREDGQPWRVGVQDPRKQGALPDVLGLTDGAVATSGSYEIYFDRERTNHHIVNSLTGRSPQTSESVSVVAPNTLSADALATSIFVMGPERGVAFIESFPRCACLIIDKDGRQWRSRGWRSATDLPTSRQG